MIKFYLLIIILFTVNFIFSNEYKVDDKGNKSFSFNHFINFNKKTNNSEDKSVINPDLKYFKIFNGLGVGFLVSGGSLLLTGIPAIMVFTYEINGTNNVEQKFTGLVMYYVMLSFMISCFSLGGIFTIFSIISLVISMNYYKKYKGQNKKTAFDFDYNANVKKLTFMLTYKFI